MFDPHQYAITIRQIEHEGVPFYEATVKEFPDIAEYAENHEDAYALALDANETTAEIFREQGRAMPEPIRPEEEAVSLNQYMLSVLAQSGGSSKLESASRK